MPKIKTRKIAKKKIKLTASGRMKRGRACTSHNTAKKSPKTKRQLRGLTVVSKEEVGSFKRMLPYG